MQGVYNEILRIRIIIIINQPAKFGSFDNILIYFNQYSQRLAYFPVFMIALRLTKAAEMPYVNIDKYSGLRQYYLE